MIKRITYYFEDMTRLDEVSLQELSAWVNEAPYSQPLHKLLDIKVKRSGRAIADVFHNNAAHHSTDLDLEKVVKAKVKTEGKSALTILTPESKNLTDPEERTTLEKVEEGVITEMGLEQKELLARKKKTKVKSKAKKKTKLIAHAEASDDKEGSVESEVIENLAEIVDYSYIVNIVESNHSLDEIAAEATTVLQVQKEEEILGQSQSAVDMVETDILEGTKTEDALTLQEWTTDGVEQIELDEKLTLNPIYKAVRIEKKSKKPKKKSKKKKSNKKIKLVENNRNDDPVDLDQNQANDLSTGDDEGESDYIKWLLQTKSINKKTTVANIKKKGKKGEKKKATKSSQLAVTKKSTKSKKKVAKKKGPSLKKMVFRAAEVSVKKRDMIMSETLADILAAQGHHKKAKKMYKQLSLIFPEKSTFFAAKIKKLKKK